MKHPEMKVANFVLHVSYFLSPTLTERSMNHDERMSDTLCKWERISKGSSVKEMKLVFKVSVLDILFQNHYICSVFTSEPQPVSRVCVPYVDSFAPIMHNYGLHKLYK